MHTAQNIKYWQSRRKFYGITLIFIIAYRLKTCIYSDIWFMKGETAVYRCKYFCGFEVKVNIKMFGVFFFFLHMNIYKSINTWWHEYCFCNAFSFFKTENTWYIFLTKYPWFESQFGQLGSQMQCKLYNQYCHIYWDFLPIRRNTGHFTITFLSPYSFENLKENGRTMWAKDVTILTVWHSASLRDCSYEEPDL